MKKVSKNRFVKPIEYLRVDEVATQKDQIDETKTMDEEVEVEDEAIGDEEGTMLGILLPSALRSKPTKRI